MAADAAATHLLVEFRDARGLADPRALERLLIRAARAGGATVLHSHLHPFGAGDGVPAGVSGVVLLAESHIAIHTWPERGYAAVDVFMCGGCDPYRAVAVLREGLAPGRVEIAEHRRGAGD